jgi:hypothetical protein
MMNRKFIQLLQIGNIIAAVLTIIVNGLANAIPIGGKYTGELSDNIPNLFVPAGVTFAIWGVIYVLIIVFVIYLGQDLFKKEKMTTPFIEKISIYFILASVANIVWIFLWHYQQILYSLGAMLVLLASLLIIYLRLNIGKEKVSLKEKVCIHVPISIYLGWITVATIANVTAVLVTISWDGFGISQEIWTMTLIGIATLLTIVIILTRRDYAYTAVIIWALFGIYLKRSSFDPVYGMKMDIANTALIGLVILIILSVVNVLMDTSQLNFLKNSK